MNYYAVKAIYLHEMDRLWRTLFQSILSPVVSTSLYFIVFGSVIGRMIPEVSGVSYGSFIVGLSLIYAYNSQAKQTGITNLLQDIREAGMKLSDLNTEQGSLEDIFVSLVNKEKK